MSVGGVSHLTFVTVDADYRMVTAGFQNDSDTRLLRDHFVLSW